MNEFIYYYIFECITVVFEAFILHQYIDGFFEQKQRNTVTCIGYSIFSIISIILSLGFRELPILAIYTMIGMFLLISLLYKSGIASRIFAVAFFILIAMVSDGICSGIIEMIGQVNIGSVMVYGLPRVLFISIAKLVQFFIVKVINFIVKWKHDRKAAVEIKKFIPLLVCQIMSILLTHQIIIIGLEVYQSFKLTVFLSIISMLYINAIIFWYFDSIKAAFEYKARNEAAEMKLELQKEYYDMMETYQKETDSIWHDMKKHMDFIKMLTETGQHDYSEKYSSEIESQFISVSEIVRTPHPIVSALLTVEKRKAYDEKIDVRLDIVISDDIKVSSSDLGIVIGNIFDNAIDACKKINDERDKYIDFSIYQKNNMLLIEIKNPYIHNTNAALREGRHGYGMKNVRRVIKRYEGNIDIDTSENIYRVKIIIP